MVKLTDSSGITLDPQSVYFIDSGRITATFDLSGRPTGRADVQVINTGGVATTVPDGFNIVVGARGKLVSNVVVPDQVRLGRTFEIIIEYSNEGDTDLLAPVMRLQGKGISELSFYPDLTSPEDGLDLIGVCQF